MNSARRAFDVVRGYINHGWESFQGSPESEAERELREAIDEKVQRSGTYSPTPSTPQPKPVEITLEAARVLYGVKANATSQQIAIAYEELRQTADPGRFPQGSEARMRATNLMQRIVSGRQILLDNIDPTVRRFEGLEIE